jgi:hypothetical protein
MTTEPTRSIPVNVGGAKTYVTLYRLPDAPPVRFTVARYWLGVLIAAVRAWLYAHAMPLLFVALGLLLAVALVVGAVWVGG